MNRYDDENEHDTLIEESKAAKEGKAWCEKCRAYRDLLHEHESEDDFRLNSH